MQDDDLGYITLHKQDHFAVYLVLTLHRHEYPQFPRWMITSWIDKLMGHNVDPKEYPKILENQPKTKIMVHYLIDRGYSHQFVGKFLGISLSAVSYHLKEKPKKPYHNKYLQILTALSEFDDN